ncbi:hypothetical protein WICMUC_005545 [Wickerhamomyces mucosus]|uniref:Uncharacterized protein n=1 Tax=Wickerhamomyces mucosus TaxID=1378264 RepID=A0A9P8P6I9_9ASCO|nr:hypothetical protein WICMUC_005545 [Wickerhamomyces mucosus]
MSSSIKYPRITIKFCTKCKWNLRAFWYAQELLQTFDSKLGEISLIPFESGVFRIELILEENINNNNPGFNGILIWDRKINDGFPDSKYLKQKIRNILWPDINLGHIDKGNNGNLKNYTLNNDIQDDNINNDLNNNDLNNNESNNNDLNNNECIECIENQ